MSETDIIKKILIKSAQDIKVFKEIIDIFANNSTIWNIIVDRYKISSKDRTSFDYSIQENSYELLGLNNTACIEIINDALNKKEDIRISSQENKKINNTRDTKHQKQR